MKQPTFIIILFLLCMGSFTAFAQFPPPAGQPGSTAIHKDSSIFVAWGASCAVIRGPEDISNAASALATAGEDWMATGKAGQNGTVSLGDGGYAIISFGNPIYNGLGWDFAIFENSFSDEFLELAFVEVSSDGINFFRFPSTSLTQDSIQIGSFGTLDATKIDNLAGKYRALYGTPFDLEELSDLPLNINNITHIKIIDVVGSINNNYATFDHYGNKINDPFPTPFASGGFDLDAVGVIHSINASVNTIQNDRRIQVYPNPASTFINVSFRGNVSENARITVQDILGNTVLICGTENAPLNNNIRINTGTLKSNFYFVVIETPTFRCTEKVFIINE